MTAACLLFAQAAAAQPSLSLISEAEWKLPGDWFGGFSGIEMHVDGSGATLITDKGMLATIRLHRTQGRIAGIELQDTRPLLHANGTALRGLYRDAEGLALGPNGMAFVSFEHQHRVVSLDRATGQTKRLADIAAATGFEPNAGLEALALHPNGTLYTLPERSGARRAPFDLFALTPDGWQVAHLIPRRGPFLPVGADFDPAGLLYLLERAVTPLGFRSRIRRFDLSADPVTETTLLTTRPARFDNLEGLSLWQDATGATHLTLISDNNFLAIQRTQIVEFTLTE